MPVSLSNAFNQDKDIQTESTFSPVQSKLSLISNSKTFDHTLIAGQSFHSLREPYQNTELLTFFNKNTEKSNSLPIDITTGYTAP